MTRDALAQLEVRHVGETKMVVFEETDHRRFTDFWPFLIKISVFLEAETNHPQSRRRSDLRIGPMGCRLKSLMCQENGFRHDLLRALNHARFNLAASYQGNWKLLGTSFFFPLESS